MRKLISARRFVFRTLRAFILKLRLCPRVRCVESELLLFSFVLLPLEVVRMFVRLDYLPRRTNSCTISCFKEIYFGSFCDLKPNKAQFQSQLLLLSLSETGQPCAQASTQQGAEMQLVFWVQS